MGKAGSVHVTELDRARDEFLDMQEAVRRTRREVEKEFREKIEEEIEYRTRSKERAFAVRLVELKEAGATYEERVAIIGTAKAHVMRKYMELGGGATQKRLTGTERAEERKSAIGVRHIAGNDYGWTVEGTEFICNVLWQNGKPVLFPVGDAVITLRDEHGMTAADFRNKGAEVASAFDLKEGV